jgi:hypothetical protein
MLKVSLKRNGVEQIITGGRRSPVALRWITAPVALCSYNFGRPHHGYRVRGRTPAIVHGAIAAARWSVAALWGDESVTRSSASPGIEGMPRRAFTGGRGQA